MEENKEYLYPEYSPSEDDDDSLVEIDEDEARLEKLLDEQYQIALDLDEEEDERRKASRIMSNPFENPASQPWGNSGSTNKPWENNQGSNSWRNSNSGWGQSDSSPFSSSGPSWNQQKEQPKTAPNHVCPIERKRILVVDMLDCLYESWESNNKPDIMPRAIFDLKPKFDVWDKLASFAPSKIYVIFPAPDLIPSLGNPRSSLALLEYVAHSITTYLRIPRDNCTILKQMMENMPKERVLMGAIRSHKEVEDMVYIGTHTGRWGLSRRDVDAAKNCGIDYIDMYELLNGKYEYE